MNCLLRYMIVVLALLLPLVGNAEESTLFNRLDTDKSGHLSKDELLKSDLVVVTDAKGQKQLVHRDMVKEGEAAAVTEEQKQRFLSIMIKIKTGISPRKSGAGLHQTGLYFGSSENL